MADQLYIKTDGPVADPSITAGKVYPVIRVRPHTVLGLVEILNDDHAILYPMTNGAYRGWSCDYLAEGATWHFCDEHGNPVPAPWEGEKESQEDHACKCSLKGYAPICGDQMRDDGTDFCENRLPDHSYCAHRRACHSLSDQAEPGPINYRAHAEALAEALRDARSGMRYIREQHGDLYGVGFDRVEQSSTKALAAFEAAAAQTTNPAEQQPDVSALVEALERIASWPDGGNQYGQHHIKMFAAKALAAFDQDRG